MELHFLSLSFFVVGVIALFFSLVFSLSHSYCKYHSFHNQYFWGGGPRDVIVKAMDCGIVVSELVLQSRYYVHFRANTLGKGMNPLILLAMG